MAIMRFSVTCAESLRCRETTFLALAILDDHTCQVGQRLDQLDVFGGRSARLAVSARRGGIVPFTEVERVRGFAVLTRISMAWQSFIVP